MQASVVRRQCKQGGYREGNKLITGLIQQNAYSSWCRRGSKSLRAFLCGMESTVSSTAEKFQKIVIYLRMCARMMWVIQKATCPSQYLGYSWSRRRVRTIRPLESLESGAMVSISVQSLKEKITKEEFWWLCPLSLLIESWLTFFAYWSGCHIWTATN